MRLAICADTHLQNHSAFPGVEIGRINARAREVLSVLRLAVDAAIANGCDTFVIAGDVFDCDHPFPDHISSLMGIVKDARNRGLETLFLVGNHDQHSNTPNDNALAPFAMDFPVYEKPTLIERLPRVLMIPFGFNTLDLTTTADIVIAHHGISEDTTHPAKANGQWVIRVDAIRQWMEKNKVSYYLAGDWHEHRSWDDGRIIQIGALAPVNWTNRAYVPGRPDPYGSLVVFGEGGPQRIVIPGPRFLRAQSDDEALELFAATVAEGKKPYIDVIGGSVLATLPAYQNSFKSSGAAERGYEKLEQTIKEISADGEIDDVVVDFIDTDPAIPDNIRGRVKTAVLRAMKEARCQ